jgi:plasmid stabilization system protein ParE
MLGAETYLSDFSLFAADKLAEALEQKMDALLDNPLMYKIYEEKPYFRCMPLPYGYICFYHVDEGTKLITVHRILRGMRDIPNTLQLSQE